MPDVVPGYCGLAYIDGQETRCTDFNLNPQQEPLFYDHIIGLNDTIPSSDATKGAVDGTVNIQKTLFRPSTKLVTGGMAFPLTENNANILFPHAKDGSEVELEFAYYHGEGREFFNTRINTYNFNITAGDIANVTTEFMGINMESKSVDTKYTDSEKLITWDKVAVTINGSAAEGLQGIQFNVNNNLKAIYTAGSNAETDNELLAKEIRVGMQEVTGSVAVYGKEEDLFELRGPSTIGIDGAGISVDLNVIFKPLQLSGTLGAFISVIPFVGIDYALGEADG